MSPNSIEFAALAEPLIRTFPPDWPARVEVVMNRLPRVGMRHYHWTLADHRNRIGSDHPLAPALAFFDTMAFAFDALGMEADPANTLSALSDVAHGRWTLSDAMPPYCIDHTSN